MRIVSRRLATIRARQREKNTSGTEKGEGAHKVQIHSSLHREEHVSIAQKMTKSEYHYTYTYHYSHSVSWWVRACKCNYCKTYELL